MSCGAGLPLGDPRAGPTPNGAAKTAVAPSAAKNPNNLRSLLTSASNRTPSERPTIDDFWKPNQNLKLRRPDCACSSVQTLVPTENRLEVDDWGGSSAPLPRCTNG